MDHVVIINPMKSRRPTGIGIAADAIAGLLPPGLAQQSPGFEWWFAAVNDGPLPGGVRALVRLALVQMVPLVFRSERLLFATHHAPLWRTGRHAVVVYDSIPLQFPAQAPGQASYYRRMLPRVLHCAQRVITISDAVRSEFQRLGYPGMDQATVIPSWSPAVGSPPITAPTPEGARKHLLLVGARYPHKNLDTVLAAIERLNAGRNPPLKLVIAGCCRDLWAKPWGGLEWFEQRGWVEVVERATALQLTTLYAEALALIYPSLAEGQGLPPLEAMAQGCAVICSDLPVMRETCGEAAWYFSPLDSAGLAQIIEAMASGSLAEGVQQKRAAFPERLEQFGAPALMARWRTFMEHWR